MLICVPDFDDSQRLKEKSIEQADDLLNKILN
jgi:hypothetical protein